MNEREGTRNTDHGHKDPASLERDIDRTRASLGRTVDALERRLSPGELLDQALGMARDNGGEFAANLGRSVRNNPMPVILTGVGLTWMMASSNEPRASSRHSSYEDWTSDDWTSSSESGEDGRSKLKSGVASAKSAVGKVGDRASRTSASVKHSIGSLGDRAGETGERMRMQGDRVRQGFEHLMEEQPLVVGAIGLALGAALGAAFPRTQTENRLLGDARDSVMHSAKDKAAEAYDEVKGAAADLVDSAKEKHEKHSSSSDTEGQRGDRLSGGTSKDKREGAQKQSPLPGSASSERPGSDWRSTPDV